jgi:hypothetical protein
VGAVYLELGGAGASPREDSPWWLTILHLKFNFASKMK